MGETSRSFGVELEGYTTVQHPSDIPANWRLTSDASIRGGRSPSVCRECDDDGDVWEDGNYHTCTSCNGRKRMDDGKFGYEFVSKVLKDTDDVVALFDECLLKQGWQVDKWCGTHVHIDGKGMKAIDIKKLIALMTVLEPFYYAISDDTRWKKSFSQNSYETKWYCQPLNRDMVSRLLAYGDNISFDNVQQAVYGSVRSWSYGSRGNFSKYENQRYYGLNLHAFFYLGTIEFRYFESFESPEEVLKRVDLCMKTVEFARNATYEQVLAVADRILSVRDNFEETAKIVQETLELAFEPVLKNPKVFSMYGERISIPRPMPAVVGLAVNDTGAGFMDFEETVTAWDLLPDE
jgi:hypothetical protein